MQSGLPHKTNKSRPREAPVVLVCSADMATGMPLCAGLARRGAAVCGPAGTARFALRLMRRRERIDAAVLDVELLDGVCTSVAAELSSRRIPFWAISNRASSEDFPPAFRAGRRLTQIRSMEQVLMEVDRSLPRGASERGALEIVATCPACRTVNRLVASSDLERSQVACSSCRADLGRLEDLIAQAKKKAGLDGGQS